MPLAAPRPSDALRLAALAAALLPFAALTLHSHPTNDDWILTMSAVRDGIAGCNAAWYRSWVGRFTATAAQCANPLVFGSLGGVRVLEAALLAALCASAYGLVSALAPRPTSRAARLALALFLVAVHLQQLPSIVEYAYTMTAVTVYGLGDVLLMLSIAAWVEAERGTRRWPWTAAAAIAGLLGAGTNEIVMLLLLGCFALAVVERVARRRPPWSAAVVLAAVAAGVAVVLLAPGTAQRLRSAGGPGLGPAAWGALVAALSRGASWLAAGPLLPAAALVALGAARTARETVWEPPPAIATGAATVAAFLLAFLPPFYGNGSIEPRTEASVHLVLAGGVLYHAAVAGRLLALRRGAPVAPPARGLSAALYAAVVLLALAPSSSNLRLASADLLSGRAARFDDQLSRRYALLAACRSSSCVVPRLTDTPRTLFWFEDAVDRGRDSEWYKGYKRAYAQYFGKQAVLLPP